MSAPGVARAARPAPAAATGAAAATGLAAGRRDTYRALVDTMAAEPGLRLDPAAADAAASEFAARYAGWPADAPVSVVSRAGWPDALASDHALAGLGEAALLHAGRPTVVVVGAGARKIDVSPSRPAMPAQAEPHRHRIPSP